VARNGPPRAGMMTGAESDPQDGPDGQLP